MAVLCSFFFFTVVGEEEGEDDDDDQDVLIEGEEKNFEPRKLTEEEKINFDSSLADAFLKVGKIITSILI